MPIQKALFSALFYEYIETMGKQPENKEDFWKFAAHTIFHAFLANADDECWEWQHDITDKHAAAILADFPELAEDEESLLYQEK